MSIGHHPRSVGLWHGFGFFHLRSFVLPFALFVSFGKEVRAADSPSRISDEQRSQIASSDSGSRLLRVSLNASTTRIIQGAVYGLDAEMENISSNVIGVDLSSIQLAVQPELGPADGACTWFYEAMSGSKHPETIFLQAGDRFTVFFNMGSKTSKETWTKSPNCQSGFWGRMRKRLDFVPGNYTFVFTGTLSSPHSPAAPTTTDPSPQTTGAPPVMDQHFFTATANLPVAIDQAQIILYAGLGGLLALLVTNLRSPGTAGAMAERATDTGVRGWRSIWGKVRQAMGAALLSITVTVVASRLSTTQFPVKVSVDDFWGALTVGFISFFVGGKFIDKLSDSMAKPPVARGPIRDV